MSASAHTAAGRAVVLGAGGHGLVVAEGLAAAGWDVLGFIERGAARAGERRGPFGILGGDEALARLDPAQVRVAIGVGGMTAGPAASTRKRVLAGAEAAGFRVAGFVHPSASVSPSAALGEGVQVHAAAVVQAGASVAMGTIVNTRAVVEHDCAIGPWAHVAPGAVLLGDVRVGAGALVGGGATVLPGVQIAGETLIGAGAVLTSDADGGVWTGVPARRR